MSDLTVAEMQDKIKRVEEDLQQLQSQGGLGRKLEVLLEYKKYLEDELEFIKREQSAK